MKTLDRQQLAAIRGELGTQPVKIAITTKLAGPQSQLREHASQRSTPAGGSTTSSMVRR